MTDSSEVARLFEIAAGERAAWVQLRGVPGRPGAGPVGQAAAGWHGDRGLAGRVATLPTATAMNISMDELKRAVHALQTGRFRTPATSTFNLRFVEAPTGDVIGVAGCMGQAGCTTIAVAIATAAATTARVVECCPAGMSGLVAAAESELGEQRRLADRGP